MTNNRKRKLKDEDVKKILELYFTGWKLMPELSEIYKVSKNSIRDIIKGNTWKHIKRAEYMDYSERVRNPIVVKDDYIEIVLFKRDKTEAGRVKIDIEDLDKIKGYRWNLHSKGYAETFTKNDLEDKAQILMHRLLMGVEDTSFIDHINHDGLDNRKVNLRIVTRSENGMNNSVSSRSKSGVIGVSYESKRNRLSKWRAYISVDKKQIDLGYFENLEDAIVARLTAEKEYYQEFSPQKHLFEEYDIK